VFEPNPLRSPNAQPDHVRIGPWLQKEVLLPFALMAVIQSFHAG